MIRMIKVIAVALMITATQVQAQVQDKEYEACDAAATVSQEIAVFRDRGGEFSETVETLMFMGLSGKAAFDVAWVIYVVLSDNTPEEIYAKYMNECLGVDL